MAAIRTLQQRMRSQGLADFLDVNIPVGKLMTQAQILKRILNQAKVADILEVNLDKASLEKAKAQIKSLPPETVPVNFDLAKLDLAKIQAQTVPVHFDVSNLPKLAPMSGIKESIITNWSIPALKPLADAAAAGVKETIPITFDVGKLPPLPTLGVTENIGLNITGGAQAIAAETAALKQMTDAVTAGRAAIAGLASTEQGAVTAAEILNVRLAVQAAAADRMAASVAAGRAAIAGLASSGAGATTAMQEMSARLAILDGSAMNFATATVAVNKTTADAIPLWSRGAGALAGFGGWFAFGTGKIQLFGGALTAMGIPLLGTISLWHLAVESLIEITAVLLPATVAFAAFGALAVPTAQHISVQLQNIWTAANALNTSIYPLTSSMQHLGDAVKPEVYQLFGEALVVASKDAGMFTKIAQEAGAVLVQLGARAAVALTSGGFGTFLAQGPADLAKISDIIANLFGTVGNLLKVLPGYAEILLTALDDVTKGIEAVTGSKLGEWLAASFLYFHGFIVWAGLAVTAAVALGNGLLSLGAKFGIVDAGMTVFNAEQFAQGLRLMLGGVINLGAALVALDGAEAVAAVETGILAGAWAAISAVNPFVWIAVAVAGLTALALWLSRSTSATNAYNTAVKNSLGQAPVTQFGVDLTASMATTTGLLAAAQSRLGTTAEYVTTANVHLGTITQSVTSAYAAQLAIVQGYQGELATLQGYQANYNQLVKTAGGNLTFLSQAGITSNDIMGASATTMKQYNVEVAAARAQTETFATSTGRVGAVMNALNYTGDTTNNMLGSLDVDMAKVVQGQDALTNVIVGGEQAFLSFQDAITGASAKLQTPAGLSGAASVAGASIGGLNAQSQNLANSFYNDSIPAFQKLIDATEMQLISQSNLTKVVATGASQMIPYVGANAEARTAIVALINNALGPGTVSLQTLNTWVSKNSVSLNTMNAIIATSTINASALGGVLTSQLNTALANSILAAEGGGKAISTFATDVYQGTTQSNTFYKAGQQVIAMLLTQSGNNVPAAQKAFMQYAGQLGLTTTQANQLWTSIISTGVPALDSASAKAVAGEAAFVGFANGGLGVTKTNAQQLWAMFSQQNLDVMSTKAGGAKAQFIALAQNGLDLTKNSAQALWNTFVQQKLDEVGTKAGTTKSQFETLAGQLGLTKTAADNLWASLHKVAAGSPYNASVGVKASGTGGMTYTEKVASAISSGGFSLLAAGGKISQGTGPTADDVLARVSKGETVVSAADSKVLAPAFSALGIPGYAAGGIPASLGSSVAGMVPWAAAKEAGFVKAVEQDLLTKELAHLKAAVTAAMGGGSIVAFAESFLGKIPYVWGGTSLSSAGADCSGFTQAVYGHFGISAPRTSEAQGAWVKRGAPTPGGLAFYHSPPGGPDPGHVAIVANGSSVVSQGGGMGPQMMALNGMPLLFTGTPPGGFPGGAGGVAPPAVSGQYSIPQLEALWDAAGGNPGAAYNMARIAIAESGGRAGITNSIGAAGLWQIYGLPFPGNPLDPMTNARMAVSKYNAGGYMPWVSDPVAAALIASGLTYAAGGLVGQEAPFKGNGRIRNHALGALVGSYDSGGYLPPGLSMAWNGTGKPEPVGPTAGAGLEAKLDKVVACLEAHMALTRTLIQTTASVPAGVGRHVGGAVSGASAAASFRSRYPGGGA